MSNQTVKKILFVSYFFDEKDGVGSLRSRSLVNFLYKKQCEITIIKHDKLGKISFLKRIYKEISSSKYNVVYITCGPFFHLLFLSLLCKIKSISLVIDIRDGWSLNIANGYGLRKNYSKKGFKYKVAVFIEKVAYFSSSKFVVCTCGMYSEYEKLFEDSSKLLLIENGYDFHPLSLTIKDVVCEKIRFVCVGKFAEYGRSKARDILLMVKRIGETKDISITFIGSDIVANSSIIQEIGLSCEINFLDRIEYSQIKKKMASFDFGLLVVRDENIEFGTKVFDYIGLSKPILFKKDIPTNFVLRFNQYLVDENEILENKVSISFIDNKDCMRSIQFEKFKNILYLD